MAHGGNPDWSDWDGSLGGGVGGDREGGTVVRHQRVGLLLALVMMAGAGCGPNYKQKYNEICGQIDERMKNPLFFAVDEETYDALYKKIGGGNLSIGVPVSGSKDGENTVDQFSFGYGINFVKAKKDGSIELGRVYNDEELNVKIGPDSWQIKAPAGFCYEEESR